MKLGAFSVSLNVKDLQTSKSFYEKLGFNVFAGQIEHHYLIMKNGDVLIGLFQNMFEKNILTFNPGWDQNAGTLDSYTDVRDIQNQLINSGISISKPIDADSSGPASFVIEDPDGNPILFDQHL